MVYSKFVVADIADLGASPGTGGSRGIRVAVSEPGVVSDGDAAAAHGCDFPTCQIRTDVSARGPGPGADFTKRRKPRLRLKLMTLGLNFVNRGRIHKGT